MAYAKDFVSRLDRVEVAGLPLASHRVLGRYDFTPFYRLWDLYLVTRSLAQKDPASGKERRSARLMLPLIALASVLSLLYQLVRRPTVVLFAIDKLSSEDHDHDARLTGVYEYLRAHRIRFVELIHTMPAHTFWPHMRARRRLPIYYELADILFSIQRKFMRNAACVYDEGTLDLGAFEPGERALALKLIRERAVSFSRSAFRIRVFTAIFRLLRPKACFLIDDQRSYGEVLAACEAAGVPSYAFQHGHFTEYHLGFLSYDGYDGKAPLPTSLYVWTKYWKDELQSLGTHIPEERIVVGGVRTPAAGPISGPPADGTLHVLVPYETAGPKAEIREALLALLADPSVHLYFKVRRDVPADSQVREYDLEPSDQVTVIDDVRKALRVDVVLGTYSTLLYDLIAYGYPIAMLHTSSDYGKGMLQNGLARAVGTRGYDRLLEELRELAGMPEEERATIRARLYGTTPVLLSDTLETLGTELSL